MLGVERIRSSRLSTATLLGAVTRTFCLCTRTAWWMSSATVVVLPVKMECVDRDNGDEIMVYIVI